MRVLLALPTMTRTLTRFAFAAALVAGHSFAAMFPPQPGDLAALIPFSFQAGEETMRAGEYLIQLRDSAIEICEDGVYCETVHTDSTADEARAGALALFFAKSGDERRFVRVIRKEAAAHPCADAVGESIETRELSVQYNEFAGLAMTWR